MRLEKDECVYLIPEKEQINIIVNNDSKKECIGLLVDFFVRKKRNVCHVYNDDGEKIQNTDYAFIYLPSDLNLKNNLEIKEKTMMNNEISQIIEENPKLFISIDKIRNELYELTTDSGVYKLRKILEHGLEQHVDFLFDTFDLPKLISMISIDEDNLDYTEKYLLILNLMMFEKRDSNMIVYLDIPINKTVFKWINRIKTENMIFIIDNDQIIEGTELLDICGFIVLSNNNYCEEYDFDIQELNSINYVFNPFVMAHMSLQTEKNIKIMKQFEDRNITFYLKFKNQTTHISFK